MFEIFKAFYSVHYNFGALALLLLLVALFLLTKKNFKVALILIAVDVVLNVFIWQRTSGNVWTITETPASESEWGAPEPQTYQFYAPDHWTIDSDDGRKLHYCWVESYMERFLSIDFVDKLWGTDKAKKMRDASESRLNQQ